jgi:hypothetical protein
VALVGPELRLQRASVAAVVLVGQKAVAIALRNSRGRRRWSKLRELLLPPAATKRMPV